MPAISVRWGGLSNPSKPKFECHIKSKGPALTSSTIPIRVTFNGKVKTFFVGSENPRQPKKKIPEPISAIATQYTSLHEAVKKMSQVYWEDDL